jgi:hypothetical protein
MNYNNYEDSIVQGRKVKIISWPADIPFTSPSSIGNLKDMCGTLHDGWLAAAILWVRMSNVDVKEHAEDLQCCRDEGETVGKKRKRHSTAGQKKKKQPCGNAEDELSRANDKEDDMPLTKPTKRAKRTPKSQMAPKSMEMVSDSDSETEGEGGDGNTVAVVSGSTGTGKLRTAWL